MESEKLKVLDSHSVAPGGDKEGQLCFHPIIKTDATESEILAFLGYAFFLKTFAFF